MAVTSNTCRKRILHVDGDFDSRGLVRTLLKGHRLIAAETINQAMALSRLMPFDLYLVDGTFEDGTGVDLCRQLRAVDGFTPIVFFTDLAEASHVRDAMEAGAQAYLIKPDDIHKLEHEVEKLLGLDKPGSGAWATTSSV